GPQAKKIISLPLQIPQSGEIFLNVKYLQKKEQYWVPEGHVIATEQLFINGTFKNDLSVQPASRMTVKDNAEFYTISSKDIDIRFNKQTGLLDKYTINNVSMLENGFS